MNKQLNSHNFENIYKDLKIDLNKLGCIMADVDASAFKKYGGSSTLYFSKNPDRKWIDGFVAGKTPHVTLLYGLLESGKKWKKYVDQVLKGWELKTVRIKEIDYFESPMKDEPYYCIVAKIEKTPRLVNAHQRLQFLPHINTFPEYDPHLTIAYVQKVAHIRDDVIKYYKRLEGTDLKVKGLNYGD